MGAARLKSHLRLVATGENPRRRDPAGGEAGCSAGKQLYRSSSPFPGTHWGAGGGPGGASTPQTSPMCIQTKASGGLCLTPWQSMLGVRDKYM